MNCFLNNLYKEKENIFNMYQTIILKLFWHSEFKKTIAFAHHWSQPPPRHGKMEGGGRAVIDYELLTERG
jgi:hypothetical protein